jgi:PAS domain-containing protein
MAQVYTVCMSLEAPAERNAESPDLKREQRIALCVLQRIDPNAFSQTPKETITQQNIVQATAWMHQNPHEAVMILERELFSKMSDDATKEKSEEEALLDAMEELRLTQEASEGAPMRRFVRFVLGEGVEDLREDRHVSLDTLHRFRIEQQLTHTLETALQKKRGKYTQIAIEKRGNRTPAEVERIVNEMYMRLRDILVTNYHTTQKAEQYRAVFKNMLRSHGSNATSVENTRRTILKNLLSTGGKNTPDNT